MVFKRSSQSAALAAAMFALSTAAQAGASTGAGAVYIKAQLSAGQEAPKPALKVTSASGGFTATFAKTKKGYTMTWRLTFDKLSGKASSAYIHRGAKGKYGPALFQLCAPCVVGSHGSAYASPSELALVTNGETYVNLRTQKNPAGEIRGQLVKS